MAEITIINCLSPSSISLLHRTNIRIEWECGGITTLAYFKPFMMALISVIRLRMLYCYFPNVKDPKALLASSWHFPHYSPHSTGQETNVRNLPAAMSAHFNYAFWNCRNDHRMDLGPIGPTVNGFEIKSNNDMLL